MLPPRQLTAFILTTSGTALLIVLFNSVGGTGQSPTTHTGIETDGTPDTILPASVADEPASTPSVLVVGSVVGTSNTNVTWQHNSTKDLSNNLMAEVAANAKVAASASADNNMTVGGPTNWRVASAQEIPFPIYPNGTRYRIGGKDGMKIALFETTDDFSTVDKYYDRMATLAGLSRKAMTQDYVQYLEPDAEASSDRSIPESVTQFRDARPGIVIHEFFNADEAEQLGAAPESKTNIIISFR